MIRPGSSFACRWSRALAWWLAVLLAGHGGMAAGQVRDRSLAQMHHTAWSVRDGAPAQIDALAQTADGDLWLATATGLFHFDGVRFERVEAVGGERLLSANVASLLALPGGGLWVGYRFGGASLLQAGRVSHFTTAQGLPTGTVTGFAVDADHSVWATTSHGLARLQGERWQPVGAEQGYTGAAGHTLMVDRGGSLWVVAEQGIYRLPRGSQRFEKAGPAVGYAWLKQAHDGSIWVSDGVHGVRPLADVRGGPAKPAARPELRQSGPFLFDRSGALWVSVPGGLGRLPQFDTPAGTPRGVAMDRSDKALTGDVVLVLLEDREGNIWMSTSGGLDRYRRNKLTRMPLPPNSLWFALAAGDDGGVWVGSANRPLMKLSSRVEQRPDVNGRMTSALRDEQGVVWFAGESGLWRGKGARFEAVALPEGLGDNPVQAMAGDRGGTLWLSVARKGMFRRVDERWQPVPDAAGLPGQYPLTMALDGRGRLWSGYANNRVLLRDGARERLFTAAQGLGVGSVLALHARGARVWVGGEFGLARLEGSGDAQAFRPVLGVGGEVFSGLSGIVETAQGDLWMNGGEGISHIAAAELQRALADPAYRVHFERFDFRDGLDGAAVQLRPVPSAVQASDGKLWFATNNSVVWIDPNDVPRNPAPPTVQVRALRADERAYDISPSAAAPQLPVGTTSLEIAYTALSLSIPERVRFRYQLQGVDKGWQEAGTRREAFYTNLRPGAYEFRVLAANEDGVWSPAGATLHFGIEPAFYQTTWFALMCVPAAAGLLWGVYWLRWRVMAARISDRLQARLIERERIARELHDTLLQSVQGLILRFHSGLATLPPEGTARLALETALDRAEQVLVEGRDRVTDLRARASTVGSLSLALVDAGEQGAAAHPPTRFQFSEQGAVRALDHVVHDEVLQIGREALANAFAHAEAGQVTLTLGWGERALALRIEDDGRGVDDAVLAAGGRVGHWGLQGMRERAEALQARLAISRPAQGGTALALVVPAKRAYRAAEPPPRRATARALWARILSRWTPNR
ncbi:MAG TPA: two-component regulator propeller domain-containing protein [Ideonella sp.]|nr:two-component regulator propeller domain-containing protein [Ideonella sp.]